jgi:DNA-binding GntR family transcriptional regulator
MMQPEEMAKILRQAVREGVLAPGQPLVQEDLAKRFNVSRIPVREALRLLTGDGLIVNRPGGGSAVRTLHATEVAELYDLRLAIEPALAAAIVANARPVDVKRWAGWIQTMDDQTGLDWTRTNYSFHVDMYSAADRPHTFRIISSIFDFTQPYSKLYIEASGRYVSSNNEHRAMLSAIERRNAQDLFGIMDAHLRISRTELIEFLESRDIGDALQALR